MAGYTDEQIARVCHEAVRALQYVDNDMVPAQPWDFAPQEQRALTLEGVQAARRGVTPREHHRQWCDSLREQGWRWGPEKSPEAKTHPCLVDYAELPRSQRLKNELFLLITAAMAS